VNHNHNSWNLQEPTIIMESPFPIIPMQQTTFTIDKIGCVKLVILGNNQLCT